MVSATLKSNRHELTDNEIAVRSVLMRLYRSRLSGEAFYPTQFVSTDAADWLKDRGWIEPCGLPGGEHAGTGGWRITETGVKAWAQLSAPVLNAKWRLAWQNEIQFLLGKPIIRSHLNPTAEAILRALDENGGVLSLWTVERIGDQERDKRGLETLMNAVYVVSDGTTVRLTDVGRLVMREPQLSLVPKGAV